jgi:hypothetical protein
MCTSCSTIGLDFKKNEWSGSFRTKKYRIIESQYKLAIVRLLLL